MKRTILIERPQGRIPGLLEVNEFLAGHYGLTVAAVIDEDPPRWCGMQLRKASLDQDGNIVVGEPIIDHHHLRPRPDDDPNSNVLRLPQREPIEVQGEEAA